MTPASGGSAANVATTFTTTYSDPNGWQQLQYGLLLINTAVNGANAAYGYYNQNQHKLYLRNDANTAWLGGCTPGAAGTIANSYATLNCATSTATGSGTTLTVKWALTFTTAFVTTAVKNVYLYAKDDAGAGTSWVQKGTWLVGPNTAPAVGAITPSSGSSTANTAVTLTTTYTDANGWQQLRYARLLVNTAISGANAAYGLYNQDSHRLYLLNDAGTAWLGPCAPGQATTLANSYATLNCAGSTATGGGTTLTVKWRLTFTPAFGGVKNTYLHTTDDANGSTSWVQKGAYAVYLNPPGPP